jgi:hypothetical protein
LRLRLPGPHHFPGADQLTFTVIQDKAVLAELRARVMSALTRALEENRLPEPSGYLTAMIGL